VRSFLVLLLGLCANVPAAAQSAELAPDAADLLAARLERCNLDGIEAAKHPVGRKIRVKLEALADEGDESWVIHASRVRGESKWRAVMLRTQPALSWALRSRQRELVIQHGRLTGRAITLRSKGTGTVEVSALSYTDSGPPFHFDWDGLRARVAGREERLFVRVRGWYDFEGQGRAEGAVCALLATR